MAKILVLDSQPFMRRYLEHLVEQAGHEAIPVRDDAEAAAACERGEPRLVILNLPSEAAGDVCRALAHGPGRDVPIIVTGATDGSENSAVEGFTPAAVFSRPFSPSRFVGALQQLIAEAA
jgi:DNA-binding response OmpR family regulator